MEISASSLLLLLRNFSEFVGRESETDSDNLLGKIFEERIPHGAEDNTESLLPYPEDDVNCGVVNHLFKVLKSKKIFGRNNEKEQILSRLFDPDKEEIHLSWIPIFGVPGIGKTTLAQLVYDEEAVQKHFELRVWVKVVGKEFGLPDIARGILKSDTGMTCPLDDLEDLDEMVTDTLQSHKCLIVLDEIEFLDTKTWLHMKHVWFNVVGYGSMVLITTSSKEVADLVSELPFELGKLSLEAGWSLYESLAFDSPGVVMLADIYQGIPLLLKILGCLSRFEEKISEILSNKEFLDGAMSFMDVFVVVLLCIWALPPNLMQCFAYCAIFPPECPLNKEKIIKMWIAEGFIKHSHGSITLEDIGNAYFRHLLCRSFFTDIICNEYGEIVEFRIPGLIHKLAQDVARTVFKGKIAYIGSISEDADKLSLAPLFTNEYDWKHLQTLIFLSNIIYGSPGLDLPLCDFKHLQTLDLSFSSIQELSGDIGPLYKLRYLNLSYTLIERLPDSIVNLDHLHTLILSGCYNLTVLPKQMRKLRRLKHLDLWQCDSLSCLPSGIGSLSSLQSLPLFTLGSDPDCAGLSDLRGLNKLTGRLEIKHLEHVKKIRDAWRAQLNKKILLHLGLSWCRKTKNCDDVVGYLRPNEQLEVLELTGCMGVQFPLWLPSISGLIKIFITDCGWVKLPSLGHLHFLKELQLKRMPNLISIDPEFYGHRSGVIFPSLELLGLYDMPELLYWCSPRLTNTPESSASVEFCNLNTLTIEGCPKLVRIPSFPVLSELVVWNSSSYILSSLNAIKSLQSLLIDDMDLSFYLPPRNQSVKKLIILHGKDAHKFFNYHVGAFCSAALEHLGILHCHTLDILRLFGYYSVQKLNIGYCSILHSITIGGGGHLLIELVIEDCPELQNLRLIVTRDLQKLIIKHCPRCYLPFDDLIMLPKLQYLLITGCSLLEEQLRKDSSMVSHVPCVILGNQKLENQS